MGFDATSYNYDGGYSGYAAHVIGHKNITIDENSDIDITGGNENDFNGNINADVGNSTIHSGVLSGDFSATYRSIGESTSDVLNPTTTEGSANNTRSLVVISVRGSVTPMDWVMDLAKEIIPCKFVCMADLQGINFIRFSSQNQKLGIYFYNKL